MSYIRRTLQLATAMVEGSPTWAAICGGQPRSRLIFYDGSPINPTGETQAENIDKQLIDEAPPLALMSQMVFPQEVLVPGINKRSGTVKVTIILLPPADLRPAEIHDWELGTVGAITDEINAQYRHPGKLGHGCAHVELEVLPEVTGALAGQYLATIHIDWSNT